MSIENSEIWKGTEFWTNEIIAAGVKNKLKPFNDVITGNNAPGGYGEPIVTDVILDGINCDVYHTDKNPNDSGHRIFIHKKST